jgi:hypothetical protein
MRNSTRTTHLGQLLGAQLAVLASVLTCVSAAPAVASAAGATAGGSAPAPKTAPDMGRPFRPGTPVPPAEGLAPEDRRNLMAGLIRRLVDVEGQPGFHTGGPPAQEALRVLDQLARFPEMALTVRQHRIWIRLEALPDLAEARRLIYGPGAGEDPLVYEEHFSLAQKYRQAGNIARAEEEWRLILQGIPGVPAQNAPSDVRAAQEAARKYLRPLAEWNLAVAALNTAAPDVDPARWEQALANLPPAPNREFPRLLLAFRLAEARVRRKLPAAQVEEALKLAERVAAGGQSGETRAVLDGSIWLETFFRSLAHTAFEAGAAEMYQAVLAPRTEYYTERRAFEASELYRKQMPTTAAEYEPILQLLRRALATAKTDYWRQRLQADIAAIEAFQRRHAEPGR